MDNFHVNLTLEIICSFHSGMCLCNNRIESSRLVVTTHLKFINMNVKFKNAHHFYYDNSNPKYKGIEFYNAL